jgi:hypothetical protein
MDYDDWDDEDDYYPYEDDCRLNEDEWEDDDDWLPEYDMEYQRSIMNPIERMWFDFTRWLWNTRLYQKWYDWRSARKYRDTTDIPF